MPQLVNGDFSSEAKKKGATIDVQIPSALVAQDVTPGPTPSTPQDSAPTTVPVPLDNWKKVNFFLTDKELGEIDARAGFIPMQVSEAIKALANAINVSIFANYKDFYGYVPAASAGSAMATDSDPRNVRKLLNQQLCPLEDRRFVLDFGAEANALGLASFRDASQSTDNGPIIKGRIGEKYGFLFFADDHVPTHTAGGGSGYLVNNGSGLAVGAKTAAVDTGTGTLVVGDIITFAGHSQTYVITTAHAGGAGTIAFEPGLVATVADNAAITKVGTHVVNLAFHRDAIAFAMRPLADLEISGLGNVIQTVQDPVSGLVLRLEISRQNKQTVWEFDALWGSKVVRRELGARLGG